MGSARRHWHLNDCEGHSDPDADTTTHGHAVRQNTTVWLSPSSEFSALCVASSRAGPAPRPRAVPASATAAPFKTPRTRGRRAPLVHRHAGTPQSIRRFFVPPSVCLLCRDAACVCVRGPLCQRKARGATAPSLRVETHAQQQQQQQQQHRKDQGADRATNVRRKEDSTPICFRRASLSCLLPFSLPGGPLRSAPLACSRSPWRPGAACKSR
jgi:hypothetical protein